MMKHVKRITLKVKLDKTSMLRSGLCDYNDAYILVKGNIIIAQETAAAPKNANKKVIFKTAVRFTSCISRLKNMLVVMSMCNLKKYSDNLSKTSGILWQH